MDTLDIWDLAEKGWAPTNSVDLNTLTGTSHDVAFGANTSGELFLTAKGHPIVTLAGKTVVVSLPPQLTTPLQTPPPKYAHDERSIDTLVVNGYEDLSIFPTLEKHCRKVDVPPQYAVERDVMRRIVAGIHPLQAWT